MQILESFSRFSSKDPPKLGEGWTLSDGRKGVLIGVSKYPQTCCLSEWYGGKLNSIHLDKHIDEEFKYGHKFYQIALI